MDWGRPIRFGSAEGSPRTLAQLLAYAAAKGAISNFTAALAQMLPDRGIRVSAVAPGPDLDAAHPLADAGGEGGELRPAKLVPGYRVVRERYGANGAD